MTMKGPICPCCNQDVKAQVTRDALIRVVDALLLFFQSGAWDAEQQLQWITLTGNAECTTRSLCNFARREIARSQR